jgi:hypothetical protein
MQAKPIPVFTVAAVIAALGAVVAFAGPAHLIASAAAATPAPKGAATGAPPKVEAAVPAAEVSKGKADAPPAAAAKRAARRSRAHLDARACLNEGTNHAITVCAERYL